MTRGFLFVHHIFVDGSQDRVPPGIFSLTGKRFGREERTVCLLPRGFVAAWLLLGLAGAQANAELLPERVETAAQERVAAGMVKTLVFGVVVIWVCCYKGYNAKRMATGVSRATTEAVVLSSVLILAWDYFMTAVML